ncbi:MAG: hypothetical protein F6K61_16515 [Sphaerospermopsis sp. SIO1G1]|nr:hypothetical protein [Sphaerospermopsis sp. SIO1G1]
MTTKKLLLQEINSMSEIELIETLNIIRSVKQKKSKYLPKSQITEETEDWENFCFNNLNECYGDDEPEYSLESIKEYNPEAKFTQQDTNNY